MHDRQFLYVIGVPGSGKTTALRTVLGLVPSQQHEKPIAHVVYPDGIQLGAERGKFSGTDAMPLNVQPQAIKFIGTHPAAILVAEGDRLANDGFFQAVKAHGYALSVVYLDCPPEVAEERRLKRAADGIQQNRIWVKGRETKVRNLAEKWAPLDWWIDANVPPDQLSASLGRHPVLQTLTAYNPIATAQR